MKDLCHERAIAGSAPDAGQRTTGIQGGVQFSPKPPPCEQPYAPGFGHQHPRFPSGDCVICGALCTEGCKHEDFEAWEQDQTS